MPTYSATFFSRSLITACFSADDLEAAKAMALELEGRFYSDFDPMSEYPAHDENRFEFTGTSTTPMKLLDVRVDGERISDDVKIAIARIVRRFEFDLPGLGR